MARIGWTAAAVVGSEPESWYRLLVFDDGWVEVPAAARTAARVRSDLRRVLVPLAAIVVLFGISALVPHLDLSDRWANIVSLVTGLAVLTVLVVAAAGQLRRTVGRMRDSRADRQQLKRERAAHGHLRRRPGAPTFLRATSAEQLASWLTPVRLFRASDVAALALSTDGEDSVAVVTLTSGAARAYRTPDQRLHSHLSGVALAPGARQELP